MTSCYVNGCSGKVVNKSGVAKGLCNAHGHRMRRYGDPEYVPPPRPISTCSVEGCSGQVGSKGGRGYCCKHYKRFLAHGDPLGGSTEWGAARRFVEEAAVSDSDECIIFPYFRNSSGYGHMNVDSGRYVGAHVFSLELRVGPKPTPSHEACHICGNGHLGCVNGKHLYWGTRSDNVQDAMAHGTAYAAIRPTGEDSPNSKFSNALIATARARMASGEPALRVARELGISQSYIYHIRDYKFRRADNDNQPMRERRAAA